MTQAFGSTGPLDWTATEEQLAGIGSKFEEVRRETSDEGGAALLAILDEECAGPEGRRDRISTMLMELYRLHSSRAAFALLYELNAPALYQQVVSRLRRYRCRADALDVLQEVFFNVYRYPHRFDCTRGDAFRVWTATIVRNTVLKHLRSLSRSGRGEVGLDEIGETKDVTAAEPIRGVIDEESAQECTRVYLNYLYLYLRFYQMLSEREQRAIQLVEVEGQSYRDAARELGIRLENLKMVIFRARRKIHRSMRRVFEGLPPDLRPAREPAAGRHTGQGAAETDDVMEPEELDETVGVSEKLQ
ncbi:MAG: RNA polymerase sigma factor [Planctomycetes bacterium]|nr:RNA polymerase sigma factor [Planctomycetota bacterium]